MEKLIDCPYCPGKAGLRKETKLLSFRKEEILVTAHYYKCVQCGEEFTTTESDEITISQLYNQYRERNHIPFTEEIVQLRKRYDISAAKMSEVLGLGANTYSNYEKGEIPSTANARLISAAKDPKVFLSLVEQARESFTANAYAKLHSHIHALITKESSRLSHRLLPLADSPDRYNGYRVFSELRLKSTLMWFLTFCMPAFNDRIKINKLLFFTDFFNYSVSGQSLTGLKYRAIQYGPAPAQYDQIFAYINEEAEFSSNVKKLADGSGVEIFSCTEKIDTSVFSEQEKNILSIVTERFEKISSMDIIDLSHKELGWLAMQSSRGLISYQEYAFSLKALS